MSISKEEIFKIITQHTCEVIPELEGHEFKYEDRLAELGANSVDRAEISMAAMETLKVRIPRVALAGVKNMGELAEVLYEESKSV